MMINYEVVLWSNCNNKCSFCPLINYKNSSSSEMINAIDKASKLIEGIEDKKFNLLIIGGELFCWGKEVSDKLVELFSNLPSNIEHLNTNSNLLLKDLSVLERVIETNYPKLELTTSYDVYGRFKNEEDRELWWKNLIYLREKYPEMKIGINLILTTRFIERAPVKILNMGNKFLINLIPYVTKTSNDSLSPNKGQFFDFINFLKLKYPDILKLMVNRFINHNYKQVYFYDREEGKYIDRTTNYLPCGHSENFINAYAYNMDKKCPICELKVFLDYI